MHELSNLTDLVSMNISSKRFYKYSKYIGKTLIYLLVPTFPKEAKTTNYTIKHNVLYPDGAAVSFWWHE